MEWQPIQTAPKDGTKIIVYDSGEIMIVEWKATFYFRENWGPSGDDSVFLDGYFNPTHWMPLPKPPEAV